MPLGVGSCSKVTQRLRPAQNLEGEQSGSAQDVIAHWRRRVSPEEPTSARYVRISHVGSVVLLNSRQIVKGPKKQSGPFSKNSLVLR